MTDEKADETDIRKTDLQVGREDGLKGPADSPKVGDFRPTWPACEQGDNNGEHRPIAKLEGERMLPDKKMLRPKIDPIPDIVRKEEQAEADRDRPVDAPRAGEPDRDPKKDRDRHRQNHDNQMGLTEKMESRLGIHAASPGRMTVNFAFPLLNSKVTLIR